MARFFGMDGVRAKAGDYPLDRPTVRRLGGALARALRGTAGASAPLPFPVGTRYARVGHLDRAASWRPAWRARRGVLISTGVVPTPAVAYLTPRRKFVAGVVISASHNPFEDNGIKVFSGAGEKFTEERERRGGSRHGRRVVVGGRRRRGGRRGGGSARGLRGARRCACCRRGAAGGKIAVVDCANGATTTVAPAVFAASWRSTATFIGQRARRPQHQPAVRFDASGAPGAHGGGSGGYRLGVAFDGDGDRAIFVDAAGKVVDGDAVMLMCAKQMQARGPSARRRHRRHGDEQHRPGDRPAQTPGIELVRCRVGDK